MPFNSSPPPALLPPLPTPRSPCDIFWLNEVESRKMGVFFFVGNNRKRRDSCLASPSPAVGDQISPSHTQSEK